VSIEDIVAKVSKIIKKYNNKAKQILDAAFMLVSRCSLLLLSSVWTPQSLNLPREWSRNAEP
jgi:hypothetical protein